MTRKWMSLLGGLAVIAAVIAIGLLPRLGFLSGGEGTDDGSHGTGLTATTGEADIGGPFTLVNGAGETVTESSFPGRYLLVYFGYTYCPDVCPTSLQTMALALERLDPALLDRVQPLFITVDPARDDRAAVADYAAAFHPRLVGLTGTPDQVAAAASTYRVYYAKVEQPESAIGYLMDHSAITYLMAPDGSLAAFFRHGSDPEAMADEMRVILGAAGAQG
ncbi:SCO family protein [Roseospira goensis]|uniref:Protein SCO1/2 n=1 Tax=Roseospira goensis TaxID=391922 RepID=A0A7W6RZW0_9PROT|nr:SCO family protein [Roseospira goensis]MBB4286296.1 protein SCO1/2 [Roseospira goensis]